MNIIKRLLRKKDVKKVIRSFRENKVIIYDSVNLGGEPYLIEIGEHTLVSPKVTFINHDESKRVYQNLLSTDYFHNSYKTGFFGKIIIGKNCFIGYEACILPNTIIEDNVIIGARSLVKGNLESGWVYAGVPAKKICTIENHYKKINEQIIEIPNDIDKSNYFDLKDYLKKKL